MVRTGNRPDFSWKEGILPGNRENASVFFPKNPLFRRIFPFFSLDNGNAKCVYCILRALALLFVRVARKTD